MAGRSATTLVFITRHELVRADFAAGASPRLLGLWNQPRPDLPDQAALVEAALSTGPKAGRRIWVLSSDIWTQSISLSALRSSNLQNAELAAALNFEVEGHSGHAAFESVVAFLAQPAIPAERAFWVLQMRNSDLDLIDETVRRAGSTLAGVVHPSGLPVNLGSNRGGSWRRLELWADAVAMIFGDSANPPQIYVVNSAPQLGHWKAEWQQRRNEQGACNHAEVLIDIGVLPPDLESDEMPVPLDEETSQRGWLTTWASALGRKNPGVPTFRPPRRPMSAGRRLALACAVTLLVATGCFAHYRWWDGAMQDTEKERHAAAEPAKRFAELQKRSKELEADCDKLKKELTRHNNQAQAFQLQRQRLIRLVTGLSELQPDNLMVEKVENSGGEPRIHGVCWQPELADLYAARLSIELRPHGWAVDTPKKKTQDLIEGGGPCSFEIQLHAMGGPPMEPPASAGKAGPKVAARNPAPAP